MTALTRHAAQRCQQRAIRASDIEPLKECGTEVSDGIFMRRKDVERAITRRLAEIRHLERLSGTFLVMKNDAIITGYHALSRKVQRLRREFRDQ